MSFRYVFLWTDILLYILVALIIGFFYFNKNNIMLKSAWRHIARRPAAVFSCIVFLFFSMVALLDSIHFYVGNSARVQSLLDSLISPIGKYSQKTFSAPFSVNIHSVTDFELFMGILGSWLSGMFFLLCLMLSVVLLLSVFRRISCFKQLNLMLHGEMRQFWYVTLTALFLICSIVSILLYLSYYYHILGTDKIGEDVLYQTIKSIRTGLVIGTLTTLFMLPFAIFFGTIAGYFSGWVDDVVQYIYATISSIPGVLLIVAAILSLQIFIKNHPSLFDNLEQRSDIRLLMLCAILGLTVWTDLCRLIRAETLKLREMDFVKIAVVMGVSRYKIILRHIVPNLMHIILITVTLNFSMLVLSEAVLSYVGVGVDPNTASWGNMINSARFELAREPMVWWPLLAAFVFMFALVFSANVFSDAVRDALDPKTQGLR